MPMQRWIASAAGGTNQRLNLGRATIRARSRNPDGPSDAAAEAEKLIVVTPCTFLTRNLARFEYRERGSQIGERAPHAAAVVKTG
jgi:hypothetical protein